MMHEKLEQGDKMIMGREKVLVPVLKREAPKGLERELKAEPQPAKAWEMPRQWYTY